MAIKRFVSAAVPTKSSPPYSKAVRANGFVFVSGQVGVDAEGVLVGGGVGGSVGARRPPAKECAAASWDNACAPTGW